MRISRLCRPKVMLIAMVFFSSPGVMQSMVQKTAWEPL